MRARENQILMYVFVVNKLGNGLDCYYGNVYTSMHSISTKING